MEFLVTMTTLVPAGTGERAVADMRAREAAHSRELTAQGHLRRLWRPPLQPGEWRSIGLFAAAGPGELEKVLSSMPLRVWRSDQVTPLSEHPNDPGLPQAGLRRDQEEFLTTFIAAVPAGTADKLITQARAAEKAHSAELGREGFLVRLWRLPEPGHSLGLWRAPDPVELQDLLAALPLAPYMTVDTTPLTQHPSDPLVGES